MGTGTRNAGAALVEGTPERFYEAFDGTFDGTFYGALYGPFYGNILWYGDWNTKRGSGAGRRHTGPLEQRCRPRRLEEERDPRRRVQDEEVHARRGAAAARRPLPLGLAGARRVGHEADEGVEAQRAVARSAHDAHDLRA